MDIPKYSAPSEVVIPKEQLTMRTVAPNEWLSNMPRKGDTEVCAEKKEALYVRNVDAHRY